MSSFYFHAARMYVYKANAKGFDFLITKYIILTLTVKIKWMAHKSLLLLVLSNERPFHFNCFRKRMDIIDGFISIQLPCQL